ncbi:hypothetical protein [Vibrio splendidus]|uniref:hypothetical protein n=1 Tax=Vibrio splendidus TaxID=29497 RepID=UPI002469273E|nr:hypothetical protein [Vibrio splendidus]MDH6026653.1 hypothetical protein [Vibrio splendidus]
MNNPATESIRKCRLSAITTFVIYQEYIGAKIEEYHEFITEWASMEGDNMAAQLPRSTNRTAPKATPERMKAILEALRKNQKKQTEKQEESA